MFACPTRRALLSCSSNAPTTSRRLISTATANSLRPQPQTATRRYSSSSSSNSKPFGPGNRGLASKTGAFRKRDNRQQQLENNGQNTQTVAPPIPGKVPNVEVGKDGDGTAAAAAEEGQDQQQKNTLPFVARTDHLHESDVRVSSFFALHRPVSVSFPVPGHYTNTHFQRLFEALDPISALEMYKTQLDTQANQQGGRLKKSTKQGQNTLQEELQSFAKQALSSTKEEPEDKAEQKVVSELSSSTPMQFSNDAFSANYRPFHPPPAPEPASNEVAKAEPQGTTFTTIEVVTRPLKSADGQHAGYVVSYYQSEDKPMPRSRGRLRVSMSSKTSTIQALSVKRQRKLKMKKHKYKKLMKKTRTLRRKLEKQ